MHAEWHGTLAGGDPVHGAGGIRPVALEMAEHLAKAGYAVMLPDPFYRYGPYGPLVPKDVFAGDVRAILGPLMATTSNREGRRGYGSVPSLFEHPPGCHGE